MMVLYLTQLAPTAPVITGIIVQSTYIFTVLLYISQILRTFFPPPDCSLVWPGG